MQLLRRVKKRIKRVVGNVTRRFCNWEKLENQPPRVLKVELNNVCNANCVFCGYQYELRAKGKMSDELFERSLKEYVAMGGKRLSYIPIVGEPLLDKKLPERTRMARALGIEEVYTYSNGILLYRYDIDALLNSGLSHLSISTSPLDADSYERIYRSKEYDKLLVGLEKLLIRNNELGKPVAINFLIRSDVPAEIALEKPDYKKYIKPHIDESKEIGVMYRDYDSWGGMIKQEDLFGEMTVGDPPADKSRPCDQTFSLTVLYDGRVRACGCRFNNAEEDPLIIGNLKDQTLTEIWNGEKLKEVRRSFPEGKLGSLCQACVTYKPV